MSSVVRNSGYVLSQLAFALPALIILIIGVVMMTIRRNRLTPLARNLGLAGCVILLLEQLAHAAYTGMLPQLFRHHISASISLISALVGIAFVIMNCTGLALLVASVLTGSPRPTPSPGSTPAQTPDRSATDR